MPTSRFPKKLTNQQIKCIELMLDGESQESIAKKIGVARETISRWKKQDLFRDKLKEAVNLKFERMAVIAQLTIQNLATNAQSESVRLNAAKDILDRGGYKPVDEQKITADGDFCITIDYGDDE